MHSIRSYALVSLALFFHLAACAPRAEVSGPGQAAQRTPGRTPAVAGLEAARAE